MRLYPDSVFQYVDLDNIAYLRGHHPPLLLIHGDKDSTLPLKYGEENFAAALQPKELVVINGAGHDDVAFHNPKLFTTAVAKFVNTAPCP
jgi:pimeloyl-ACP methyl ester carboxylesterase